MAAKQDRFRYTEAEIKDIEATLLSQPIDRAVDLDHLEVCAESYIFRAGRATAALAAKKIDKERGERDRTVERVRRSIRIGKKAERVSAFVDNLIDEGRPEPRPWLLAQALLDGEINQWDLQALMARDELSAPDRLAWPGAENWLFSDGRQKGHRAQYINDLVCFWAECRRIRPDEVRVTAKNSRQGNHFMDFILAAGLRPMSEAGEKIDLDQLRNVVRDVIDYWAGHSPAEKV